MLLCSCSFGYSTLRSRWCTLYQGETICWLGHDDLSLVGSTGVQLLDLLVDFTDLLVDYWFDLFDLLVDFNARNKSLTAKLLQQGYRYHKLRKTFSKFYRRHYKLVSKFNVGLKTLLHQGLSEPEFYGDLVYKFKKIVGRVDYSDQFRKIILRYKRIGYNINIMRQSACLVFNPITVNNFASLFNCTPVGRASDSVMAPT